MQGWSSNSHVVEPHTGVPTKRLSSDPSQQWIQITQHLSGWTFRWLQPAVINLPPAIKSSWWAPKHCEKKKHNNKKKISFVFFPNSQTKEFMSKINIALDHCVWGGVLCIENNGNKHKLRHNRLLFIFIFVSLLMLLLSWPLKWTGLENLEKTCSIVNYAGSGTCNFPITRGFQIRLEHYRRLFCTDKLTCLWWDVSSFLYLWYFAKYPSQWYISAHWMWAWI